MSADGAGAATRENKKLLKDYALLRGIGAGTFSDVVLVRCRRSGNHFACKTMRKRVDSVEQAHLLPEVQAMTRLSPHPNILTLHQLLYDPDNGTLSLICELMDMNMHEYIKGQRNPVPHITVQNLMFQLCSSLDHMHSNGMFHRDVKPENILIRRDELKLGDFGSCRSVCARPPHTEYISTRWYRAPECMLTNGHYSHPMDVWSAGCVFYEILSRRPLFPGQNELDQLNRIHDVLGTPNANLLRKFKQSHATHYTFAPRVGSGIPPLLPVAPAATLSLLQRMLTYDPEHRISAHAALRAPFFSERRVSRGPLVGAAGKALVPTHRSACAAECTQSPWRRPGRHTHLRRDLTGRRKVSRRPLQLPKLNLSLAPAPPSQRWSCCPLLPPICTRPGHVDVDV